MFKFIWILVLALTTSQSFLATSASATERDYIHFERLRAQHYERLNYAKPSIDEVQKEQVEVEGQTEEKS